ncbi:hypothetical protein MMC10_005702 [Thelotrema lepadinum]|nr:hypothetical protein [Thelotrema lepadinum]
MAEETHGQPPAPDEEDLAEQRRMAIQWSQTFTDLLVSKKLSTDLVREEYAASDPVFVEKTRNLPDEYDHWRKLRGDGSCGLRALSFGYFELLAGLQDRSVWSREKARFADLNGLLYRSGLDEFIWVEWVEATAKLFDDLAATETKDAALNVIETRFNNADESIEILTHLRFLISYWLKEEDSRYAQYLPDMSMDEYITLLQATHSELDEVSLRAAYDMLLEKGGIALEVLYLDRSPGEKVTHYVYDPSTEKSKRTGTVHFLYRP